MIFSEDSSRVEDVFLVTCKQRDSGDHDDCIHVKSYAFSSIRYVCLAGVGEIHCLVSDGGGVGG